MTIKSLRSCGSLGTFYGDDDKEKILDNFKVYMKATVRPPNTLSQADDYWFSTT